MAIWLFFFFYLGTEWQQVLLIKRYNFRCIINCQFAKRLIISYHPKISNAKYKRIDFLCRCLTLNVWFPEVSRVLFCSKTELCFVSRHVYSSLVFPKNIVQEVLLFVFGSFAPVFFQGEETFVWLPSQTSCTCDFFFVRWTGINSNF